MMKNVDFIGEFTRPHVLDLLPIPISFVINVSVYGGTKQQIRKGMRPKVDTVMNLTTSWSKVHAI
jgi:hypothetical protein